MIEQTPDPEQVEDEPVVVPESTEEHDWFPEGYTPGPDDPGPIEEPGHGDADTDEPLEH